MGKSINDLTLAQLIELKTCADMITNYYAECLTDYAAIYSDAHLQNMSPEIREKYDKRQKSKRLSMKIQNEIEEILEEYYD